MKLHGLFSDHMVLQHGVRQAIWGTAQAGQRVRVELAGQTTTCDADAHGRWCAALAPMAAGGPNELRVTAGDQAITVRDVMIGEVWLCSGQSNMNMTVGNAADAEREILAADGLTDIRMFTAPPDIALEPQSDVKAPWRVCSPQTVSDFSAVAYYFGRELHRELGIPIGLLNASIGHTPAEAWTSREALASHVDLQPILARWDAVLSAHPQAKQDLAPFIHEFNRKSKAYNKAFTPWYAASREARKTGKPVPPMPPPVPQDTIGNKQAPTVLFNGMIAPLAGYPIRGAAWYQGETNAIFGRSFQYRTLLSAMIADWRKRWGVGEFPFLIVQLANHQDTQCEPADDLWAELRDSQLHVLKTVPNTAMAVTIDLGESDAIHPRNKQDVGRRLALAALGKAYNRDMVYSGPIYRDHTIERVGVRVRFDHVGGGLIARGGKLAGFTVAGKDGRWHKGDAAIEGNTVLVRSAGTRMHAAARYAWAGDPPCSLYNKEGLPASPFRTDDWPGVSDATR